VGGSTVHLVKPLTFMNRSGAVLSTVLKRTKLPLSNVLVVCDTLDLPAGKLRLKLGGSSAGHNGLKSLMSAAGSGEFMRLYIGIGRPDSKDEVISWVLGVPDREERSVLERSADTAAEYALMLTEAEPAYVMNEIARNGAR
jgi:PTH1 family peptidyl-tRNA hydrolase